MSEDTELKTFIHTKYEQLFSDWTTAFQFPSCLHGVKSNWDLMMFVGRSVYKDTDHCIYFCSEEYPIHGGFDGDGYKRLSNDLCRESISNGFNLIKIGRYPYGKKYGRKFSCSRCSRYRGNTTQRASLTYRNVTYHCDRKNSRGKDGLTMPRRSRTLRSICKDNCCSFFFILGLSEERQSFFVVSGYGKTTHSKHPQISKECISLPPRLLSEEDKKLIDQIRQGDANCGVISNVVFQKTGQMLSRQNCAYIGGLCNELKDLPDLEAKSSTEIMVSYLEKSNHDFFVLLHDPVVKAVRSEVNMASGKQVKPAKINFFKNEIEDVKDFVSKSRNAANCTEQQKLMMGFAWVLPCERRLFEMFPEVLTVDCTSDTNNESRPLLTMNGKDSNGKMFTVLRAFLPNEQAWVFRWIFNDVLPKMFGSTVINQIKVVISDGDSQEYEQIDNAIDEYMPLVFRQRCGWHIVEKGWQNRVLGVLSFSEDHRGFYYKVVKQLKGWMYSWMKLSCETSEEYNYSFKVFKKFVQSKEIQEKLTELFSKSVLLFLKNNVQTNETHYVMYRKTWRRHYEEYSNSIHEGTNRGLKYNAAPVTPGTRLDHSLIIMSKNGVRNAKRKKNRTTSDILSTRPHEKAECSKELVQPAACFLEHIQSKLNDFTCIRVNKHEWKVKPSKKNYVSTYIPVFYRIRTVWLLHDGRLVCSCPWTRVYGDICVHAMKVANSIPGYTGPSYQDFSVVWWKRFYHLVSQTETESENNENVQELSRTMLLLKHKEKCGLRIDQSDLPEFNEKDVPYKKKKEYEYDGRKPVVLNRNYFYCQELPQMLKENEEDAPPGLSQLSNVVQPHEDNVINVVKDNVLNDPSFPINVPKQRFSNDDILFYTNGLTIDEALEDISCCNNVTDPYSYLIQSFKELTNIYEGNATPNDLNVIKRFFSSKVGEMKKRLNGDVIPVGGIVSSNTKCSKRKKTHGTKRRCH